MVATYKCKYLYDKLSVVLKMSFYCLSCKKRKYDTFNGVTPKRLVLDLDETLVCSFDDMNSFHKLNIFKDPRLIDIRNRSYIVNMVDVLNNKGMGNKSSLWGVTRPHLHEFINFIEQYFDSICVWSAGRHEYVIAVCDEIFTDFNKPEAVYTYDHCDAHNGHIIKPLGKIHNTVFGDHNTFMVDDRKTVFHNNPDNGILIPSYEPRESISDLRGDDTRLLELITWFQKPEVMQSKDVRTLDKNTIFAQ